jgi:hypothetical protein
MKFWSGMQTKAHILYFPKEESGVKFLNGIRINSQVGIQS